MISVALDCGYLVRNRRPIRESRAAGRQQDMQLLYMPAAVIPGPPQAEPGIQASFCNQSLDSGFALTRDPE
jgi:hypothetical protein